MENTSFLLIIALILLSTKLFSIFMRRMHFPQVIGALAAGLLLGPAVFNLIEPNQTISAIADIGVIFLLFSAGMETDFKRLRESSGASLLIALFGIIAALGGGFALAFLFGKPTFESFFIGVVIAAMSTSITVETLQEMGKLRTKSGTAILGASLFDDIFVIIILAITLGVGERGFSFASMATIILKIAAFFVLAFASGILVEKLFNFVYDKFGKKRRLSIFAIAYCFLMAFIAEQFGLAGITGAFIAGIALCNTRCVEYLETRTHEISYMFFTPIFLANIGINTSFVGMSGSLILFSALLTLIAIISKFAGCGLGAKLCGYTNRESMQVGIGMIARGEVSFIVASKGILAGYISSLMFPSVIVVVLVTVLITPLLLKAVYDSTCKTHSDGDIL